MRPLAFEARGRSDLLLGGTAKQITQSIIMNDSNSSSTTGLPEKPASRPAKQSLHTKKQAVQAQPQEYCPCHRFIKDWLLKRKPLSKGDLAAALLIHILWESKTMAIEDGACGFAFELGQLVPLGIDSQEEAWKAMESLERVGILKLHECEAKKLGKSGPKTDRFLVIELPWLCSDTA